MRARLTAIVGIAFCAGALTTTWATWGVRPAPERSTAEMQPLSEMTEHPVGSIGWDSEIAPGAPGAARPANPSRGSIEPVDPMPDGRNGEPAPPAPAAGVPADLLARDLLLPVDGVRGTDLHASSFTEARGARAHEAIDILAPRGTPVRAVDAGRIVKLFVSERGGLTVYQFDAIERYCYYYAHLNRYAEDLTEGQEVRRGQIIGYVGTSGNAPPDTPHLHFAIFRLGPEKRWWDGEPIDPYALLR
jgi:murein DD-endopeptidase MepM/ murein hydrolase activator NlpD